MDSHRSWPSINKIYQIQAFYRSSKKRKSGFLKTEIRISNGKPWSCLLVTLVTGVPYFGRIDAPTKGCLPICDHGISDDSWIVKTSEYKPILWFLTEPKLRPRRTRFVDWTQDPNGSWGIRLLTMPRGHPMMACPRPWAHQFAVRRNGVPWQLNW